MASCFCLASASGVMAYVSLAEVLGESIENFKHGLAVEERIKREIILNKLGDSTLSN